MKKIFLIFSLFILFCTSSFANTKIEVIKVYDGDSILAQINDNIFRIRLTGIDCFEGTEGNRAKWQAIKNNLTIEQVVQGGNIAGDILASKLKNKNITFEFQGIDKYDRALGVLYDGKTNINKEMLKTPYCSVYKRN